MSKPVVLLSWGEFYGPGWIEKYWPQIVERCEVRLSHTRTGPGRISQMEDVDAVILRRWEMDREMLEAGKRLRAVVTVGVGVEKVDIDAATELGIVVANSPGNQIAVSEATLALMLGVSKQMPTWIDVARTGKQPDTSVHGSELHGKTVGLVGLGRIGRRVAGLCRAFGMDVLAYDPYVTSSDVAEIVPLDDLLRRSDFVSVHVVLTPETHHMIGARELETMKPSAYLINTARGGAIDEAALIDALRAGQIAGAGLDVFEVEPPELDNPLLNMPNVIATPHALPRTEEAYARCAAMTQENIIAVIEGRMPSYAVNPTVKWRVLQQV
jgi:D-3-phosphoglycerate dehydrogenase / 2-oxoglutarate reductase